MYIIMFLILIQRSPHLCGGRLVTCAYSYSEDSGYISINYALTLSHTAFFAELIQF